MGTPTQPGLAQRIDALLPQTQCRRCGHDGCAPYAEAIAAGEALNRCPPGGEAAVAAIAALTGRPPLALDVSRGEHERLRVARIDEAWCIGCALCLDACPVDAIVGAQRRMHAVLPALCTGCELCLAPCPVDCIAMVPAGRGWSPADARAARERFEIRNARRHRPSRDAARAPGTPARPLSKAETVAAALARARARRGAAGTRRT
jgi:electron transport complex protein RnfB